MNTPGCAILKSIKEKGWESYAAKVNFTGK